MLSSLFKVFIASRSALFYLVLIAFTLVWASLSLIIGPLLPFRQRYTFIINWWTRVVMRLLLWCCGIRCDLQGLENVPQQPCILYCKHQSTWETFFLQTLFTPQSQVIKKELLSIPFFGWAFNLVSPIAIDRKDRKQAMLQVIRQGTQRLQDGVWVLIFPEGTRINPGDRKAFTKGGARLAVESGYPLLPIAHNAGLFWPNNHFLKYPGTIQLVIGEPLFPAGLTVDELTALGEHWIQAQAEKLEQESIADVRAEALS